MLCVQSRSLGLARVLHVYVGLVPGLTRPVVEYTFGLPPKIKFAGSGVFGFRQKEILVSKTVEHDGGNSSFCFVSNNVVRTATG